MNDVWVGLLASLGAGLMTGVGALPVMLPFNMTDRVQGVLLGIGGGVMLAATSFSLLIPGAAAAQALGFSETAAAAIMVAGVLLGGFALWSAHAFFPHEHFFKGKEGKESERFEQIWLFVIAIALHNFPEGLTVGVGLGSGNLSSGIALASGIGLQNMPEGLVVVIALRNLGYSPLYALAVSTLTGLVEPVGGLLGASVVTVSAALLPWGMAFAAGAMLFVIIDEILPDIDQKELGQVGTFGVMVGFVVMMFLDVTLG
ncbi:MAG: ZIP family metal transporter [Phormidesmis sp.]